MNRKKRAVPDDSAVYGNDRAVYVLSDLYDIFNSFHNYILTRPKDYGFNGLEQLCKAFEDPVFFKVA